MGRRVTTGAVLLLLLVAVVRAHLHFIRVVVLAAAGLAGLYLLHLVAQDIQRLRPRPGGGSAARAVARLLFRRSAPGPGPLPGPLRIRREDGDELLNEVADFDYILEQDPKECARLAVCALACKSRSKLLAEERAIVDMLGPLDGPEVAGGGGGGGRVAFQHAAELGRRWRDAARCEDEYPKCPYSAPLVLKLFRAANTAP